MDEAVAGAGVGREFTGARELEALDDGGLAGAVGADDESERFEEGNDVLVLRAEAPDPLDQHLVHRTHLSFSLSLYSPLLFGLSVTRTLSTSPSLALSSPQGFWLLIAPLVTAK